MAPSLWTLSSRARFSPAQQSSCGKKTFFEWKNRILSKVFDPEAGRDGSCPAQVTQSNKAHPAQESLWLARRDFSRGESHNRLLLRNNCDAVLLRRTEVAELLVVFVRDDPDRIGICILFEGSTWR